MKREFDLPYIENPTVFKAVKFAQKMIVKGDKTDAAAVDFAAGYYGVNLETVRDYVALWKTNASKRRARTGPA